MTVARPNDTEEIELGDALYGINDELVRRVLNSWERYRIADAAQLTTSLHGTDVADLLEQLPA